MYKKGDYVKIIQNTDCGRSKNIPIGTICYVINCLYSDEGMMVEIIPKSELPYKGYGEYQYPISDISHINKGDVVLDMIMDMLPSTPRSYDVSDDPGFWSDGTEILCPSEAEADMVAEFLRDVLSEYSAIDVHTGYYDPDEDAKSGEQDDHTGFYYIDFD